MSSTDTGLGADTTTIAEDPAKTTSAAPAADPQLHPPEGEPATPEQPKEGKTESAPEGAPESYEFTNPDGDDMSTEVLEAFGDAARKLNLTQDGAQSLINAALPAMAEHAASLIQEQKNEWAEKARTDKEFGGSAFKQNLKVANDALKAFGSPELNTELKTSGFSNHPEMIRMMVKVGRAISEETMLAGGPTAAAPEDLTDPDVQGRKLYKKTHTQ